MCRFVLAEIKNIVRQNICHGNSDRSEEVNKASTAGKRSKVEKKSIIHNTAQTLLIKAESWNWANPAQIWRQYLSFIKIVNGRKCQVFSGALQGKYHFSSVFGDALYIQVSDVDINFKRSEMQI